MQVLLGLAEDMFERLEDQSEILAKAQPAKAGETLGEHKAEDEAVAEVPPAAPSQAA